MNRFFFFQILFLMTLILLPICLYASDLYFLLLALKNMLVAFVFSL